MQKATGSYYTPKRLADFVAKYLIGKVDDKSLSILEPSVGNGVFIDALKNNGTKAFQDADLTIVDINTEELAKAERKAISANFFNQVKLLNIDFLSIDFDATQKYSLVIGNPPYIKKKSLPNNVVARCEKCHRSAGLSARKINNIWTAFVVSCTQQLNENGIMALVLPADLLQVKYAEEIRVFLEQQFARLEIFSLDTDEFPGIEQQTILLFAYKKHPLRGTYFFEISDYASCQVTQISSNGLMVSQSKWTHYNLSPSEIRLLNSINEKLPRISDFVDVKAGIVTGANKFFVLSQTEIKKNGAKSYSLPMLYQSRLIRQGVDFTPEDFSKISGSSSPSFLLDLSKKVRKNKKLDDYLSTGVKMKIHERYKCSLRKKWFRIPCIESPSEAFFFKRTHIVPKVIRNVSNVYVTDTAYRINSKNDIDIKNFVRSFYTVITFIYAELMGRKYGGGVLELTPNEFKNLPLLYWDTTNDEYDDFSNKISFNKIDEKWLHPAVLKSKLNLNDKQLLALSNIYSKLVANRINRPKHHG